MLIFLSLSAVSHNYDGQQPKYVQFRAFCEIG